MSTAGLVSVIIPTYNRAHLCKKAVESALNQTFAHIEVVVVDDGSTDNTREIISALDPRVSYIQQHNGGVSYARNVGIERSKGEFIALLDSDDEWLPWKLECQMAVFRRFPAAGMVWTDMAAVDPHGKTLYDSFLMRMYHAYTYFDREKHFSMQAALGEVWKGCPSHMALRKCYAGNIFGWMFMGNLVHTSTVLLKRERQRLVGAFNESFSSGEDYDFHLRTCRMGEVAYIDVSSIHYRIGAPDQITTPGNLLWMARNDQKTIMSVLEKKVPLSLPKKMIRLRLASSHRWVGMEEFHENRRSARGHLLKSLIYVPFQKNTLIYFVLSFLPLPLLFFARRIKKTLWSAAHKENTEGL